VILVSGSIYCTSLYAKQTPEVSIFTRQSVDARSLSFTEDGRFLVSGFSKFVAVWDLSSGSVFRQYEYAGAVISQNGRYALFLNRQLSIALLDVISGRVEATYDLKNDFSSVDRVLISSDSLHLLVSGSAAGRDDDSIRLFDLKTGKRIKAFDRDGSSDSIEAIALSPDNRYVASANADWTITVWDVPTGMELLSLEGHSNDINSLIFSNDGRYLLSGAADQTIRVWDFKTGTQMREFDTRGRLTGKYGMFSYSSKDEFEMRPHDFTKLLTVSRDGKHVLSTQSPSPSGVGVWDFSTGKRKAYLPAPLPFGLLMFSPIKDTPVAFSPDGKFVATGDEGSLRIWDLKSSEEIVSLTVFDDGEWVAITPEGYFNVSKNGARHLKVKVGNNAYSIEHFFERYYEPDKIAQRLSGIDVKLVHDIRRGIKTPPAVKIVSPELGASFDQDIVEVKVEAKNMGGGIDEIRLFQNESAIGDRVRATSVERKGKKLFKKYRIKLLEGDNYIRAVGFSKDRTEGKSHTIKVRYTGKTDKVDLYVFVVGINAYKNPELELNFARADALGIKDFFSREWSPLFDQIHVREIYDEQATKSIVTDGLKKLGAQEEDVVVIYLAGHGVNVDNEWYFLSFDLLRPEDARRVQKKGISSSELTNMVLDIRALKKVVFIDACKSGGLVNALSGYRGVKDRRAIAQLGRATGTHVLAASTARQWATEIAELGHGAFSYTILQGLQGAAKNESNVVTIRGLINYVENNLPIVSEKYAETAQYPVIDSRGQDFPLVGP
jgi:WD40 repeat protein